MPVVGSSKYNTHNHGAEIETAKAMITQLDQKIATKSQSLLGLDTQEKRAVMKNIKALNECAQYR